MGGRTPKMESKRRVLSAPEYCRGQKTSCHGRSLCQDGNRTRYCPTPTARTSIPMTVAIYIAEGSTQLVLTPETEWEKSVHQRDRPRLRRGEDRERRLLRVPGRLVPSKPGARQPDPAHQNEADTRRPRQPQRRQSCMTPKKTIHVLKMSCGVTVRMKLREKDCQMSCLWIPGPPFSKEMLDRIMVEYIPWRNEIMEAWGERNQKRVLCITI